MDHCPELLAPAGSPEALEAALAGGADAIYLGGPAFGARAGAGFSDAALRDAVRRAHFWGKRVYVTVNTLIKPWEVSAAREVLSLLCQLGADAVLVQDIGLARIARRAYPELTLHASTQMSIHNVMGARLLKNEGIARVVLARECPLAVVRAVARELETEVFVHGALCASVSGQCLMSAMAGGRSGNRGRCAQPCRKRYELEGESGYLLSMRDLNMRDRLKDLADAGVKSLKIEGRLKRPEYVYTVTRAYREALDALRDGRFSPASAQEQERLAQAFRRGAFSEGYIGTARDATLVNTENPGNTGISVGTVRRAYARGNGFFAEVNCVKTLRGGDALRVSADEMIYQGVETPSGGTAILRTHVRAAEGAVVWRLADARVPGEIERALKEMSVPFDAELTLAPGKPALLRVTDDTASCEARGETAQNASGKPVDAFVARRAIGKTGGTPFALRALTLSGSPAYTSASALNALRRDALDQLARARMTPRVICETPCCAAQTPAYPQCAPRLIVRARHAEWASGLIKAGADVFVWQPDDLSPEAIARGLSVLPDRAWLKLPRQASDSALESIAGLASSLAGVVLSNVGQFSMRFRVPVYAGEGIPIMNAEAMSWAYDHGAAGVTAHEEASLKCLSALPVSGRVAVPVYGRSALMILNHCPARVRAGCSGERACCPMRGTKACADGKQLLDELGHAFPLMAERSESGCALHVLGARPLDLSAYSRALGALGVSWLVRLTDETLTDALLITERFARLMRGEAVSQPYALAARGTEGLFKREIE